MVPMPGYILVQRINKREATKFGIIIRRRAEEETSFAYIIHPGWYHHEFTQNDCVVVEPHCGTDFYWDDGDVSFTILPINRILAKTEGKGKITW